MGSIFGHLVGGTISGRMDGTFAAWHIWFYCRNVCRLYCGRIGGNPKYVPDPVSAIVYEQGLKLHDDRHGTRQDGRVALLLFLWIWIAKVLVNSMLFVIH